MDKAKELAILILKEDQLDRRGYQWSDEGEKQTIHILTNEIPYIFVILPVDDIGKINFYNDLYQRDDRLADLLFSKDSE
jgi:murein L,D-transpeptidase YcbB/YkuD